MRGATAGRFLHEAPLSRRGGGGGGGGWSRRFMVPKRGSWAVDPLHEPRLAQPSISPPRAEQALPLPLRRGEESKGQSSSCMIMRSRAEISSLLTNPGIIAVVRARRPDQVLPLSEALIAGGVNAIEITMTTPNALEAIREAREKLGARGLIGVGTVLE